MTKVQIINIVIVVLAAAVFGIAMYFRTKGSATNAATEFIALIENSGLIGKEKMAYVVSQLYAMIPAPLKSIFTEKRLEILAQEIFDNMKQYALEYIERIEKEEKDVPTEE